MFDRVEVRMVNGGLARSLQVEVFVVEFNFKLPRWFVRRHITAKNYSDDWYLQLTHLILRCFRNGNDMAQLKAWINSQDREDPDIQPTQFSANVWNNLRKHLTPDAPPSRAILVIRSGEIQIP